MSFPVGFFLLCFWERSVLPLKPPLGKMAVVLILTNPVTLICSRSCCNNLQKGRRFSSSSSVLFDSQRDRRAI